MYLSFAFFISKSSKMRDGSKTLVKVSIWSFGICEPIRVRGGPTFDPLGEGRFRWSRDAYVCRFTLDPRLLVFIWDPTSVIGIGLILTVCLSSFAVYSDCWEKGITQTKLCQRRGIDGHFIPIPVVIGLWYRHRNQRRKFKIFKNFKISGQPCLSVFKRECSYLKRNELQRLKCDDKAGFQFESC